MSTTDLQTGYSFHTKPYKHQLDAWRVSRDIEAYALLMDMGTGKTKVTIDTMAYLYEHGKIRGAVIIAPKGVYRNWSDKEIPAHLPARIPYHIGIWDAAGTAEEKRSLAPFEAWTGRRPELMILMMNVEAFSSKKAPTFAWKFMKLCPSLIVADESTTLKHHDAQRTKHLVKLSPYAKFRRILSGEPAANSPLDLFSQFEFLKPGILGCSSYYSFRQTYANLTKQRIGKPCGECARCRATNGQQCVKSREFTQVLGYKNVEDLQRRMAPHAFIIKKEDCLDLPPKVYQTRNVEMGKQQQAAYNAMSREAVVHIEHILKQRELAEGRPAYDDLDFKTLQEAGEPVKQEFKPNKMMTAQVVITQILRLHQIVCGFMTHDPHEEIDVDLDEVKPKKSDPLERIITFDSNPRLEALMSLIEETSGKVVIWATYRHNIREIAAALAKAYGKDSVGCYYGETKMDERRRVLAAFQDPNDRLRFFIGSQGAAGYGLTLTAAHTAIYYANNYNSEQRNQSEDRCHRIGQTKSVTIVDFICPKTVEVEIVEALKAKKSLSQLITASNWKDIVMAAEHLLKAA